MRDIKWHESLVAFSVLLVAVAALLGVTASTAEAEERIESFENVVPEGDNLFFPPDGYVFPSGLTYRKGSTTSPAVEDADPGPTGCFGRSPISPIPDGTAFMCGDIQIESFGPGFELPGTGNAVRLLVSATTQDGTGTYQLQAFDVSGNLLGTSTLTNARFAAWATNEIAISAEGIRRVRIFGNVGGGSLFDRIVFETTCGNGNLDVGEQCDDGALNGTPESCCDVTCSFSPATTPCEDGDACTSPDTCDGQGQCSGPLVLIGELGNVDAALECVQSMLP